MIKTKKQAEDMVYRSYMKAAKRLDYAAPDSEKRHPEYTRAIMRQADAAYGTENILVTGSKGKGSAAVMISALLRAHGERVGLLTSPHMCDFNERIRIDDTYITDEELIAVCGKIQPTLELIDSTIAENEYISPIGIQALIALLHFGRRTTHNVFECGKGVKYDDINNLGRGYAVINRIFAEHTRELGKTPADIAADKAMLIEPGIKFAYTAAQDAEVMKVLEDRAAACGVVLKRYGTDFFCKNIVSDGRGTAFDAVLAGQEYRGLRLPLLGAHQAENAALALAVCADITGGLDEDRARAALGGVHWPGRMEIVSHDPLVIADACINRVSAKRVAETVCKIPHKRLAAVIGIPDDKDRRGAAEVISACADIIIMTTAQNPHYRFDKAQADEISGAVFIPRLEKALAAAKKSGADMILVLGTTALLAEFYKGAHNNFKIQGGGDIAFRD